MMIYKICDICFFLKSLHLPSPAFNILQYVSFVSTPIQSSGHKLQHCYSRYNTSRHFYFSHLPCLWNSLPDLNLTNLNPAQAKTCLQQFFWSYFIDNFSSANTCSFHFRCPCSNCILSYKPISSSLKPNIYVIIFSFFFLFLVASSTCWFTISTALSHSSSHPLFHPMCTVELNNNKSTTHLIVEKVDWWCSAIMRFGTRSTTLQRWHGVRQ